MIIVLKESDFLHMQYTCRPVHELKVIQDESAIDTYRSIGEPMDEKIEILDMIYSCATKAIVTLN